VADVRIEGICKRFERADVGVQALLDVNLHIRPGEFVCLLGPSGCGKTTLLNMIAGLDAPDAGRILVAGREVKGPSPTRAVIFQEGGLFPWLTAWQNVEFGLKQRGEPPAERRRKAFETLARVGLPGSEYRYPHELSGGQKQRVAIARALVLEPDVLLCDEPFSALDATTRRQLSADLVSLWQQTRMTVVWVEHNTYLAPVLADRVIVFAANPGRVVDEVRIDLPRPRGASDPSVLAVGDFLAEWLEAHHGLAAGEPVRLPRPPRGADVRALPPPKGLPPEAHRVLH
jgi:NitT/TauT family transport system ATP-binding protein